MLCCVVMCRVALCRVALCYVVWCCVALRCVAPCRVVWCRVALCWSVVWSRWVVAWCCVFSCLRFCLLLVGDATKRLPGDEPLSTTPRDGSPCSATNSPAPMLIDALFFGGSNRPVSRSVTRTPCPNQRAIIACGSSIVSLYFRGETNIKKSPQ